MFSLRLTALSSAVSFIAGVLVTLAVWNYIERGKTIEAQKNAMASKDAVIEIVSDRGKTEEELNNAKEKRIKNLGDTGRNGGMCPAVRAAIDGLY